MVCKNCNFYNTEGRFCAQCGAPLENQQQSQAQYNQSQYNQGQYNQAQYAQPQYSQEQYAQPQYNQPYNNASVNSPYPMKWYKWLIYFLLFFSAFVNLTSINYLTGNIYLIEGVDAETIYAYWGTGLKVLDIFYGIAGLCMIPLCLVTRSKLAKFKADAPKFIDAVYGVSFGMNLIYTIGVIMITGNVANANISGVAMTLAIYLANHKYFERRSELFRN